PGAKVPVHVGVIQINPPPEQEPPRTWLVCTTCGSTNQDIGGDPTAYLCGVCGHQTLVRVEHPRPVTRDRTGETVAGGALGAGLGAAFFGPVGALVGLLLGAAIANRRPTK